MTANHFCDCGERVAACKYPNCPPDLAAQRTHFADDATLKRIAELEAENAAMLKAVRLAYGHLWHVNNEPAAPIPIYTPEKAAYAARKLLRDLLTSEQRGDGINATQNVWGDAALAAKRE